MRIPSQYFLNLIEIRHCLVCLDRLSGCRKELFFEVYQILADEHTVIDTVTSKFYLSCWSDYRVRFMVNHVKLRYFKYHI
jgi:hypothetical protein